MQKLAFQRITDSVSGGALRNGPAHLTDTVINERLPIAQPHEAFSTVGHSPTWDRLSETMIPVIGFFVKTWVTSQWKFTPLPGQLSTKINTLPSITGEPAA